MRQSTKLKLRAGLHIGTLVVRRIRAPKISRDIWLLLIQLAGAFSVLYGISMYSIPIALIVGGIGAIAAVEMQTKSEKTEDTEMQAAIRETIKGAIASGEDPFSRPGVPLNMKYLAYAASLRRQT